MELDATGWYAKAFWLQEMYNLGGKTVLFSMRADVGQLNYF